jgi:hypothetical protein
MGVSGRKPALKTNGYMGRMVCVKCGRRMRVSGRTREKKREKETW